MTLKSLAVAFILVGLLSESEGITNRFLTANPNLQQIEPRMQLFLDTADVAAWDKYMKWGIFYGITTNPILLERAKLRCEHSNLESLALKAINEYNVSCFMLQTWGRDRESLVQNGRKLAGISPKIVVKVPLTVEGIEAAAILKNDGNTTHSFL